MDTTTTTFTKLRSGSWGIRGLNLVAGSTVTVTKKSGESKSVTVGDILGQHKGQDYATIASTASPRRAPRATGYYGYGSAKKCYCSGRPGGECCEQDNCQCYDCQ